MCKFDRIFAENCQHLNPVTVLLSHSLYSVLRCVTLCYVELQRVTVCYGVLRCVTVCYGVLRCSVVLAHVCQPVLYMQKSHKDKAFYRLGGSTCEHWCR